MIENLFRSTAISIVLLGINSGPHAEILPNSVHLQVYGAHQANEIVYHYKLINNSSETLRQFVLGSTFNPVDETEQPQLERLPAGWSYGQVGETGTEIKLSPLSTTQPPYWIADVYGQEGSGWHYLKWETEQTGQGHAVVPGQSLAGFSVRVPLYDPNEAPRDYWNATQVVDGEQDDIYLTGNFKVSYWDSSINNLKNVWGQVEIADTTPPTLSVTLTPNVLHQNGRYIPITATITTKDDLDPEPAVKLLSITANEPIENDDIRAKFFTDDRHFQLKADHDGKSHAGRIYTVTYFVTDGSGNQAEASATVTVPHKRKEPEERREERNKKDKDERKRDR